LAAALETFRAADPDIPDPPTYVVDDPLPASAVRGRASVVSRGLRPKAPGEYRLRVWLQDSVGFIGAPATAPIPHDTTPPAAPQSQERVSLSANDRFVRATVLADTGRRLSPLSVSSDRIALTAHRPAQLRELAFGRSGIRFDRAGGDRVVEVYLAAALLLWGFERGG
jgi:hypothetical protein